MMTNLTMSDDSSRIILEKDLPPFGEKDTSLNKNNSKMYLK